MKTMIKVAIITMMGQGAAAQAEEARPVAVDIAVDAGVAAADNELSRKARAIARALEDGDDLGADQLLGELYTARSEKEEEVPVQAHQHCCHCSHQPAAAAPAEEKPQEVKPEVKPAATAAGRDPVADYIRAEEAKKKEAEAKAKEKEEEAKEKAKKQKEFNVGLTILTVALLLLILL